jgi:hypothetical protein
MEGVSPPGNNGLGLDAAWKLAGRGDLDWRRFSGEAFRRREDEFGVVA